MKKYIKKKRPKEKKLKKSDKKIYKFFAIFLKKIQKILCTIRYNLHW